MVGQILALIPMKKKLLIIPLAFVAFVAFAATVIPTTYRGNFISVNGGKFTGDGGGITNLSASAAAWQASPTTLIAAVAGSQYQPLQIARNAIGVVTNALILWPDGTYGNLVVTNIDPVFQSVNGYYVTYTNGAKTVYQSSVTRDSNGSVTNAPALVVTP